MAAARADDFRTARRRRRFHRFAQALLVLTLCAGLNHLAARFPWRHDLTEDSRHRLADETRSLLAALPAPVRIVVSLSPDDEEEEVRFAARELTSLLREFSAVAAAAGGNQVSVDFVDVERERTRAVRLGLTEPRFVLVESAGRERRLDFNDLYETRIDDPGIAPRLRRIAFLGERALASAVLEVTGDRRPVLYFIAGHGELSLDDVDPARGLSVLRDQLRARAYELRQLDMTSAASIPDDAAMVLALGPQVAFRPSEQEILRQYLSRRAGRLLLMLDPGRSTGLDDLFWDWGVLADDVVAIEGDSAALRENLDLVIRRYADHPITSRLATNQIPVLVGLSRTVRPDPGRREDAGLTVFPLLRTSDSAWGERAYSQSPIRRDNSDLQGPLDLATLAERRAATQAGISVPGGRLIVFGTSDFVTNQKIAAYGNLTLFLNCLNWAIGRDDSLAIPPRPVRRIQVALSAEQASRLRLVVLGVLPGSCALAGLLVFLMRRR